MLRGSSLVRTLVVASATLAILFVCFSMYQFYSQSPREALVETRKSRLPSLTTVPGASPEIDPAQAPSVSIDNGGTVGPGRDIRLTIYPRDGVHARMEVEVRDWTPRAGALNEFLLVEPVVRLRTKDGNAVRVAASEGILEAERRGSGGSLDPKRGRLNGNVVVEYDRLSEKERALLPPPRNTQPEPSDLIRVEMDEVEFDLEYGKLTAPGEVRLTARDAAFTAHDLEARFGEGGDRLETLRIARGGRLELSPESAEFGKAMPGLSTGGEQKQTVSEWLWTTFQQRFEIVAAQNTKVAVEAKSAQGSAKSTATSDGPASASNPPRVTMTPDGVPVFRPGAGGSQPKPKAPVQYFAQFRTQVTVEQRDGDATISKLSADELEIIRPFTERDRRSAEPDKGETGMAPGPRPSAPRSRVVVEWADRLVVESLAPEDPRWSATQSTSVTASGVPVKLAHSEGEVTCLKLAYEPDTSKVKLHGSETEPVRMDSLKQGTMSSSSMVIQSNGERFTIQAVGPGTLNPQREDASGGTSSPAIRFSERFEAEGHSESGTRIGFTGLVTTEEQRLLDRATFTGPTHVQQGDFALESDALTIAFGIHRGLQRVNQTIETLNATGHVILTQPQVRMTCDELHAQLQTEGGGRTLPRVVTGKGNVVATQGDRTISAKDELVVDFGLAEDDAIKADRAAAAKKNADLMAFVGALMGNAAQRNEVVVSSPKAGPRIAARRIRARGDVKVVDAKKEVRAADLDCSLDAKQDLEMVIVNGTADQPATIRQEEVSVTGRHIEYNESDQRADVPGEGRLTFRSGNHLSGRQAGDPEGVPVVVTWTERMRYQGREKQAVFAGNVHVTSGETSTVDGERVTVEFENAPETAPRPSDRPWSSMQDWFGKLMQREAKSASPGVGRFKKDLASILVSGNAVVVSSSINESSGVLQSRARLSGPRISVNLRPDISKMRVEGAGDLLIESFEGRRSAPTAKSARPGGLIALSEGDGPSKRLIRWKDWMQYDFSLKQARFEGNVDLKHVSGEELDKLFPRTRTTAPSQGGRFTQLTCDTLTADFVGKDGSGQSRDHKRIGQLSDNGLRQFDAIGTVQLQDETEGLTVAADRVTFEQSRQILSIDSTEPRKARLIKQKPGQLPYQVSVNRLVYNLSTGQVELSQPTGIGH